MIKDLKDLYRRDLVWYWTNATGDVNMPGHRIGDIVPPEQLPPALKSIYDKYWSEGAGTMEYVMTLDGKDGIAIGWLFDRSWMEELGLAEEDESRFRVAIIEAASVFSDEMGYDVLYGEETDPEGYEVLMFLSSSSLENDPTLPEKAIEGGNLMYKKVEASCKRRYLFSDEPKHI